MWLTTNKQHCIIGPFLFLAQLVTQVDGFPVEFGNGTTPSHQEEPHPVFDINGQSAEEEHRPSHFEILSLDWHHVETVSSIYQKHSHALSV